jgi:transcriptional regulator with XRE-family HTH domain
MDMDERLREARERRGMTQGELAAKLGVSTTTVTLWENRKNPRKIGTKYLKKVADALEIRVSELLGEVEQKPQPGITTADLIETQLLRLFRLMPQKVQMIQLAQFVECVGASHLDHAAGHEFWQQGVAASIRGANNSESR